VWERLPFPSARRTKVLGRGALATMEAAEQLRRPDDTNPTTKFNYQGHRKFNLSALNLGPNLACTMNMTRGSSSSNNACNSQVSRFPVGICDGATVAAWIAFSVVNLHHMIGRFRG
jgi:hypothetical protein